MSPVDHTPARPGTVYLVGAGPGAPDLITARGLSLLRHADVVVYDRLVHPDLLAEVRTGAELIYVGKAPGRKAMPQTTMNDLLIAQARRGRVVVRLKGGDPFVFGRGGEEGRALSRAGVRFEIVPGVTSAIGVPAYAGIPLTFRGLARSFTVATGHLCTPADEPDWTALARAETLVLLMGLGNLPTLSERLIAHGRAPETPAAVVRAGTTETQVVRTGTLADIPEKAADLTPPAVIVIGEVVGLRSALNWFGADPDAVAAFPIDEPLEAAASAYSATALFSNS